MARTGKIARLPRHVRNELNHRIDHGEPAAVILKWLNGLDESRIILDFYFDGKSISESNLTAWRQGGFLDWQRHRESCAWVRELADETDQIGDESGPMPLSDRVSSLAAMLLGKHMRNFHADAEAAASPAGLQEFHAFMKDLAQLRREDREAARLRIELERHAKSKEQEHSASVAAAEYCAKSGIPRPRSPLASLG